MTSPKSERRQLVVLDDPQGLCYPHLKADHISSRINWRALPGPTVPPASQETLSYLLYQFEIMCTMRERTAFPRALIKNLPNLRLILTTGNVNAAIDLDACREAGIVVAGTGMSPEKTTVEPMRDNTAQHTWALVLALANNIPRDNQAIKIGHWQSTETNSVNLAGKTLAILGLGRLGTEVARVAITAFGMRVLAWSTSLTQQKADDQARSAGLPRGSFVLASSKAALFEAADVLSVHYVLSQRSRNMVTATELALLKPSAMFINTSQGPLVDATALFETLNKGKIRGAGLDVFWSEPLPEDSRWRKTPWGEEGRSEVVMTPHTGYASEQTMENWWLQTAENLERYLDGKELRHRLC